MIKFLVISFWSFFLLNSYFGFGQTNKKQNQINPQIKELISGAECLTIGDTFTFSITDLKNKKKSIQKSYLWNLINPTYPDEKTLIGLTPFGPGLEVLSFSKNFDSLTVKVLHNFIGGSLQATTLENSNFQKIQNLNPLDILTKILKVIPQKFKIIYRPSYKSSFCLPAYSKPDTTFELEIVEIKNGVGLASNVVFNWEPNENFLIRTINEASNKFLISTTANMNCINGRVDSITCFINSECLNSGKTYSRFTINRNFLPDIHKITISKNEFNQAENRPEVWCRLGKLACGMASTLIWEAPPYWTIKERKEGIEPNGTNFSEVKIQLNTAQPADYEKSENIIKVRDACGNILSKSLL